MKKPFLPFLEIGGRWEPKLWLFYHLGLPALLVMSIFIAGPLRINTSLSEMLPQSTSSRAVAEAEKILGERSNRQAIVLAAAEDFDTAKKGASLLYAALEKSPDFDEISFYYDSSVIEGFAEFLHKYRFAIAGRETLALLESGRAGKIAEDALVSIFGAFTFIPLNNLETDPFLLANRRMEEFISSPLLSRGSMSPKDNVLAAYDDGIWYVMLRLNLNPRVVSVAGNNNGVPVIWAQADAVTELVPGLSFYYSGVPFHSYESSSSAQREISIISFVTVLMILAFFLYIFRSPLPVIFSILDVGTSIAIAAGAALLFFREIHIITFVFGTTLIGIGVDFSIHFFIHWKGNNAFKDGVEIRSRLFKTITVCFVSTEICFSVFLFAPFLILKQFAVFSMAGILSAYLTFYCIYPFLKMPPEEKRKVSFLTGRFFQGIKNISVPFFLKAGIAAILAASGLLILFFHPLGMKIENNISSLYTMSNFMMESEKRSGKVLDYGSHFWYFIVSGSSLEETLEHEESLVLRLEEEVRRGNLGSVLGTTVFVPSIKTQEKTYGAMRALLPLAEAQFDYLGFPSDFTEAFYREFEGGKIFCLPENAPPLAGLSNLWIGETGGNFYSCVMPLNAGDEGIFRSIADEFEFAHFISKAKDIGRDLDTLTRTMLLFFLAAYAVIFVIVCFLYPWKDSVKICAVPFFLVICTWAAMAVNMIPMGFFSAAALILVFGLGLDYTFYMVQRKRSDSLTLLAVILSFLTTLLSFGALAFSSFRPVHIFGFTVFAGLSAAFIFAMLLQGRKD